MASEALRKVDGIMFGRQVTDEALRVCYDLKTKSEDVFLVTFPKSGTTWTQNIMFGLRYGPEHMQELGASLFDEFPFIERQSSEPNALPLDEFVKSLKPPVFFKTHLPIQFAPREMFSKNKIVLVIRNPKETLVSFENFYKISKFLCDFYPGSLEKFAIDFLAGEVVFGDWWKWTKGWADYALENPDKSLIMFYEDLLDDFEVNACKAAKFLGYETSEASLKNLKDACGFTSMKERYAKSRYTGFFRSGSKKTWEGKLSPDIIAQIDDKTLQTFGNYSFLNKLL